MKHFCSFGNTPKYNAACTRIKQQALDSGYFDTVTIYDQTNTPGIGDHKTFIDTHRRGYGYWIWKPMVILDQMSKAALNDIIVYADAGCFIHATEKAKEVFAKYMSALEEPPYRISFRQVHIEKTWCKGDLLDLLGVRGSAHAQTGQIWAGIQILKNTPENKALMEEWLSIMTRDSYRYVDDSPSISPNEPIFREHRHDQSVISLLMKLRGTYYLVSPGKGDTYPIAAMRSRDK